MQDLCATAPRSSLKAAEWLCSPDWVDDTDGFGQAVGADGKEAVLVLFVSVRFYNVDGRRVLRRA